MNARRPVAEAVAARRRADLVAGLRGLAARSPAPPARGVPAQGSPGAATETEACDLCGVGIPDEHRHLLHLTERRIVCSCETCWAMRSGEGDYRPTGNRTLWLAGLEVPDDLWAGFQIPIGLAFFMESTVTGCVVAMYPSPGGATESELHFESWAGCGAQPRAGGSGARHRGTHRQPDGRPADLRHRADRPLLRADRHHQGGLEGISGGPGVQVAVDRFFEGLRAEAASP